MPLRIRTVLILATLGLAIAQPAAAADEAWKHTVVIYGVGASIDGKVGAGDLTTEIDLGFDDILDNLHMGAMGAYRGERGPWAVTVDVMWLNLQNDKGGLGPQGETWREIELDQFISELDLGYALNEQFSVYGGLRYWDVDTEVTVVLGPPLSQTLSGRLSEDWIDPVIGLRYLQPLGANWTLMLRSDLGGFGVGSDLTWHVTGLASWNLSEHASLLFGFRYIDLDYDDGTGSSRFLMDLSEGGPTAGFAWRF